MTADPGLLDALHALDQDLHLVEADGRVALASGDAPAGARRFFVPAVRPENLGDASFRGGHGLRYAYLSGAMANGIGSADIVEEMARAGMLGFFGAAGLSLARVEAAVDRLSRSMADLQYGFNLI